MAVNENDFDDEEEMTDEEWEEEKEAIMDSMYPEGYDPDVDGLGGPYGED